MSEFKVLDANHSLPNDPSETDLEKYGQNLDLPESKKVSLTSEQIEEMRECIKKICKLAKPHAGDFDVDHTADTLIKGLDTNRGSLLITRRVLGRAQEARNILLTQESFYSELFHDIRASLIQSSETSHHDFTHIDKEQNTALRELANDHASAFEIPALALGKIKKEIPKYEKIRQDWIRKAQEIEDGKLPWRKNSADKNNHHSSQNRKKGKEALANFRRAQRSITPQEQAPQGTSVVFAASADNAENFGQLVQEIRELREDLKEYPKELEKLKSRLSKQQPAISELEGQANKSSAQMFKEFYEIDQKRADWDAISVSEYPDEPDRARSVQRRNHLREKVEFIIEQITAAEDLVGRQNSYISNLQDFVKNDRSGNVRTAVGATQPVHLQLP